MRRTENYYSWVVGSDPDSFINVFRRIWQNHIRSFPQRYQESRQLVIGSRFRPLLVSWGYLLSGRIFAQKTVIEVANLAVYIEVLHKATLLIDDLIDEDIARRGEVAFHIEHSSAEAILFAIYLLGDCLEQLSTAAKRICSMKQYPEIIDLLSSAIKEMSLGGIEEVTSSDHDQDGLVSLSRVRKIIELQTIALVKNGLLIGYIYGLGKSTHYEIIDKLGYDCGYLFQVLNDLEPFLDQKANIKHKGAPNLDILRSRKNIAAAFVVSSLDSSDLRIFNRLKESGSYFQLASNMVEWFNNYKIFDLMLIDLARVRKNIDRNIGSLPVERQRRADFSLFIDYTLAHALKRVGSDHGRILSEILIK